MKGLIKKTGDFFSHHINAMFLPVDDDMTIKVKYFLAITFLFAVLAHIILTIYFLLLPDLDYTITCASGILLFTAGYFMNRAGKTRAASLFYVFMILLNSITGRYFFGEESGVQWMPIIVLLPVIIYLDLSRLQKICFVTAVPILMNLFFILPENFFPPSPLESSAFLRFFFINMIVFSVILTINGNKILTRILMEYRQKELERHKLSNKTIHDLKNQLYAIITRLNSGEIEYAFEKLNELCSDIFNVTCVSNTGNQALDALINSKNQKINEAGIDFSLKCFTGGENKIEDMDLCILIGNALDNAIEACERMEGESLKYIKLTIMQIEDNLVIQLINSSAGEDSGENHEFVTMKKESHLHGFGLKRMREVVSKYDGHIEYYLKDGVFHLKILLPNSLK